MTHTAQPTCRLGIAAYWSALADTVPPPQDRIGWWSATMSANPEPASSRGGVVGHTAKHTIAISVDHTRVLRPQA